MPTYGDPKLPEWRPLAIVGHSLSRIKAWAEDQPLLPSPVVFISTDNHARGRQLSGVIFIDPPSEEMIRALEPCLVA